MFGSSFQLLMLQFFTFIDSLIENARNAKELRSTGVFQNLPDSDEELANLFNEVGDDLPTKMSFKYYSTNAAVCSKKYILIKYQIGKHYTNKRKTWLAEAYNTRFDTPRSMIAFAAASLAFILTFIQTWYDKHSKQNIEVQIK